VYLDLLQVVAVEVLGKALAVRVAQAAAVRVQAIPAQVLLLAHLQETRQQPQQAQAAAVGQTLAQVAQAQVVLLLSVIQEHR
jgi:hypothetical protein